MQSYEAMKKWKATAPSAYDPTKLASENRDPLVMELSDRETRLWGLIGRLVVGTNIYLNSGGAERRTQVTSFRPRVGSKRPPERPVYKITRDVQVDLRNDLQRYINGETRDVEPEHAPRGRGPTGVRYRVKGHYKSQPHGPRSSLRKIIHVEPYWVGPDEAPVAVRSHVLGADLDRTAASDVVDRAGMADVRKITVPWTCDACETRQFGLQVIDESGDRTWTMLPSGWWYYPVDYGDTDGEDARTVMLHAFCSEKCIRASLERAAQAALQPPAPGKSGPLRTTLGELMKRRHVG